MSTEPNYSFGVKALIPYDRATLLPLGIFRVISTVELAREIEHVELDGGHHNGTFAVEAGQAKNSLTATLMEFPDFAFTELDNAVKTTILGEDATGFIDAIANKIGTSLFDATTGIASVAAIAGSEGKLPFGNIIIKGTSVADEVDIYLVGDVAKGQIPVVGELPVLAAGVVIPGTGGTVQLPDFGLEFTGGSGAIALVEGDTAFFETRPANSITTKIVMPDASCIKEVGMLLVYPKNAQGKQKIVDFPKVAVGGTPFGATTREFAEFEMIGTPMVDDDSDIEGLYEATQITTPPGC